MSSVGGGDVAIKPCTLDSGVDGPFGLVSEPDAAFTKLGRRNVGGTSSCGNVSGNLSPARTTSHKCIANTNSSHDKRPSISMSDNPLFESASNL